MQEQEKGSAAFSWLAVPCSLVSPWQWDFTPAAAVDSGTLRTPTIPQAASLSSFGGMDTKRLLELGSEVPRLSYIWESAAPPLGQTSLTSTICSPALGVVATSRRLYCCVTSACLFPPVEFSNAHATKLFLQLKQCSWCFPDWTSPDSRG